jgi:hypothetical protein
MGEVGCCNSGSTCSVGSNELAPLLAGGVMFARRRPYEVYAAYYKYYFYTEVATQMGGECRFENNLSTNHL